jgi:transcriptional regulator with XRE-family HTH domain
MGNSRPRPKLLPDKLLAIREFLNVGQAAMASKLQFEILSHSCRQYQIRPSRISEYENAKREPSLFVLIAYVRLGQVHMESVVDDGVNLNKFRKRLGKEFDYSSRAAKKKSNKPVIPLTRLAKTSAERPGDFVRSIPTEKGLSLADLSGRLMVGRSIKRGTREIFQNSETTTMPNLVCRFCKTPIYATGDADAYLHTDGSTKCVKPQVPGLKNLATPFDDNATYPAYRAELISDMTSHTFSYPDEPDKLLVMILTDTRHFADANGLNFDEHERRSYELYLKDKAGTQCSGKLQNET